ncbi:Hypothetical predicted protein [Xyrichtys novacula]|uniref:Ribosomal protein L15 n=1 Tax=Xyrichtys novacula TaxID=13765 RepID=A0AAV1EMK1_XYRNO|nr:Hypothetical predicted protein [Xyrichtys novacula]
MSKRDDDDARFCLQVKIDCFVLRDKNSSCFRFLNEINWIHLGPQQDPATARLSLLVRPTKAKRGQRRQSTGDKPVWGRQSVQVRLWKRGKGLKGAVMKRIR